MRSNRWLPASLALALLGAGCGVDDVPFRCASDEQCRNGGEQGFCELTSYCSFPAAECDSGRRYAELAPETVASRCVPSGCIEEIAVGSAHTCLRTADDVYCWGDPARGKLGVRAETPGVPALLEEPQGSVLALAAGAQHSCALIGPDYEVICWGGNASGQLGSADFQTSGPLVVPGLAERRVALRGLAAGGAHTCAFGEAMAACWGKNDLGQLGNGSAGAPQPIPVAVEAGFAEIALGGSHGCGRREEGGAVVCWGDNSRGQVSGTGDGLMPTRVNFQRLEMPLAAAELALGEAHSCALLSGGQVVCWGDNTSSQLGLSRQDTLSSDSPQPVAGLPTATHIAAGSHHTCALLDDGRVACWGENEHGQLGPEAPLGPGAPAPAITDLGEAAEEIRAGGDTTCARTGQSHTAYCWGSNDQGQLGNGAIDVQGQAEPDATLTSSVSCPF